MKTTKLLQCAYTIPILTNHMFLIEVPGFKPIFQINDVFRKLFIFFLCLMLLTIRISFPTGRNVCMLCNTYLKMHI